MLTCCSNPSSLAPYERRVIELLRNSKDKRARKLAKKRVRSPPSEHLTSNFPSVYTCPVPGMHLGWTCRRCMRMPWDYLS